MNQESLFCPQLSQQQKQFGFNLNQFYQLLPAQGSQRGSNQSLERMSSEKIHEQRQQAGPKVGRKGKRGVQELKNVNRGHWSTEENKKYHWFLEIHYRHFVNRHMRRTDKIFKTMQIFIGTRQAEQCRSHHQKMEKKYLNFISIIANLREIHYATHDVQQIMQEIEGCGLEITDTLATIDQLKAYKLMDDEIEPPPLKKLNSLKSPKQEKLPEKIQPVEKLPTLEIVQNVEQQKQHQIQENGEPINMFEQSRNNFGEISMYHEKEDNSCIFQSIFQHQN